MGGMKRVLGLAVVILAGLGSAARAQDEFPPSQPILNDFERLDRAEASRPAVSVPEVYELASIIVSLTPYGSQRVANPSGGDFPDTDRAAYIAAVRSHFSAFADHPVVAAVGADNARLWWWMYDFRENSYLFQFDDARGRPDRLVHHQPFSHVWARPDNGFTRNVALVEDFARVSGFRQFYNEHRAFYDAITRRDAAAAPAADMHRWLQTRFSARWDATRVVYSPLTGGWHSTQVFTDDDFSLAVMFIEPGYPTGAGREIDFARILFTEVDHNYVNPASDLFRTELDDPATFASPIWVDRAKLGNAYPSGYNVFNEHMTFAVFELWARETYSAADADRGLRSVRAMMTADRGFPLYPEFSDKVAQLYAEGTARSSTYQIAEMYPALIAWAKERDSVD